MISTIQGFVLLSCVSQNRDGAPILPLRLSESDSAVSDTADILDGWKA